MNHERHRSSPNLSPPGREAAMRRRLPKLFLSLLLAALIFLPGAATGSQPLPDELISLARFPNEVKLRKLHLVRPDLIPYPLFFEVYA
jgi:hypothetical protein